MRRRSVKYVTAAGMPCENAPVLIAGDNRNRRPRRAALLLAATGSLLTGACAMRGYEPVPMEAQHTPQNAIDAYQARDPQSPLLRDWMNLNQVATPEWPPTQWSFEQLVWLAWFRHPQLQAAGARIDSARRQPAIAKTRPNPALRITPEHYSDSNGARLPLGLAIDLDIPLTTGDKRPAATAQAQLAILQAQLDRGEIAVQLRSRLRDLHVEWQAASAEHELDQREQSVANEVLALLERRLDAGMAGSFEVAQARGRVIQAQRRASLSRLRVDELFGNIAQTCRLSPERLAQLRLAPLVATVPPSLQPATQPALQPSSQAPIPAVARPSMQPRIGELRYQALTQRVEIKRAAANYALAEAALRLEIARQYPDLALRPGLHWEPGVFIWSVGAAMVLPLMNRNEAQIELAQARRAASALEFAAVQQQIVAQLDAAVARVDQAAADLQRSDEQARAMQQRVASVQKRFDRGLADRLDLTLARLDAIAAQRWPQQALAEYDRRRAALDTAIGDYAGALRRYDDNADARLTDAASTDRR